MGYAKISNLYKRPDFLDVFRKVWVLEKIHGTSTHIKFKGEEFRVFAGGADHSSFARLFDEVSLKEIYNNGSLANKEVTLFGEGYGGKMQGMSNTYGKGLRFIVFDILVDDKWLDVPDAKQVAERFGQEFVWYKLVDNSLEELNKYRDQPSELAKLRGCGDDKPAEGIIVKPLYECYDKNGGRWYVKHKRAEFCETASKREIFVDHGRVVILKEAEAIANEWAVPNRLNNILSKIPQYGIEDTGKIIQTMIDDIKIEAGDQIDWRMESDIKKFIGKKTAKLFKDKIQGICNT